MPISDPITRTSLNELVSIFSWVNRDREKRRTILIGGWAIYIYNPYFGSVDIDLITTSRTRNKLTYHLRKERGFEFRRRPLLNDRKLCLEVNGKPIDLDFGFFSVKDRFDGRKEFLDMKLIKNRTRLESINGIDIEVPDISMLFILKTKAAWDRWKRLDTGTSFDREWDQSKLIKDRSDLMALIDCEELFDIGFLGKYFEANEFLKDVIMDLNNSRDSIKKYGSPEGEMTKKISDFKHLIF